MSDQPPSSSNGSKRSRSLFGFVRKSAVDEPVEEPASSEAATPQAMRLRIAEFETSRVEDVMVPRADVIAVEAATSRDDLIKLFAECAHSRLPVYRETLDDPVGFIHIKDLVAEIAKTGATATLPIERLCRNILFVPPSMQLADLLVKMQATRIHMALVVDEYGGTDGLVSLEDLVEEIVGDIEDEHDENAPMLRRCGQNVWEVDARMEIEDFATEAGLDLALSDFEDEIDTLGGVAFALAGRVPERGEVLSHPSGADIEILDSDGRRIRRVRLRSDGKKGAPEAAE